ncbi:hypothetical protein BDFB_003639 [Asbolus verrucosus]|uniref:Uncharacterized protein n=1 Tax=Asbolus verrucosus TaxID=1661398 RepID=A0A482VBK1_ASBVE|nr:hypothetical protein BDFB_003639 [Asbolus verrucosus]
MGEFSLSGNANIGLSAVEIPVNTSKNSTNPIFYTTPTSTSGTDSILQAQGRPVMQDELVDKAIVSGPNGDEVGGSATTTTDKSVKDCESGPATNDLSDKLSEQVSQTKAAASLPPLFHPAEAGNPSGALWSAAIEDTYVPSMTSVNGSLGFQNFPSPNQQQLFGNNANQNQGRRAITASHNFPHNMGRQQSGHPLYKGYGSWANPGQSWSGSSSAWNRGRSVPNLTPLQQMGVAGRKPSPTFNHQQVISPVKFRRSTSYPGKGPFPQPPTFEITNMDEARDLLPYQVMCGTFEHCTVTLVIATLPVATR